MNPPLILASASLSRQPHSRRLHRSKRRRLVGVLATLTCAFMLGLALLAGVAAGGMVAIVTREHLNREADAAAPRAPEPSAAPNLSVTRRADPQPTEPSGTNEAADLTRAFRRLYQASHPHTAESEAEAWLLPPPSA